MSETPTFGRYAELPYDKMTPEQQAGYNAMIEARGRLPGPTKIWVHNPKLAKVAGPFGAHFQPGGYSLHGDWMNGWDPAVSDLWGTTCIRDRRNCGAANLGDGRVTLEFQGN